jgi:hypothetical protein
MAQLLEGRFLLHFSQKFGYFCNGVSLKSQANNGAGPGFPLAKTLTKCNASQSPGWLSIRGIVGGLNKWCVGRTLQNTFLA